MSDGFDHSRCRWGALEGVLWSSTKIAGPLIPSFDLWQERTQPLLEGSIGIDDR